MATGFLYHPTFLLHDTGRYHPESAERLRAIVDHLESDGWMKQLEPLSLPAQQRPDLEDRIQKVHTPSHLTRIQTNTPSQGYAYLDPDTPLSPASSRVGLMAVEGTLTAIDAVMAGRVRSAFCAIRPPGHHAESTRAMGFCLLNNVAIGARYLRERHGLKRVLIVDWDVHHGNGTQEIFYHDPSVMYVSLHQYPWYPGTGSRDERGAGPGEGYTLNFPLPAGKGDEEYLRIFDVELTPAVREFRPEFILISAGFDAHEEDPLAGMRVTDEGFGSMTRLVKGWAEAHCGGRVVSCLEGGYNHAALARSVERHLEVLHERA
jgi:acetoin utilization deacetylase AcuC-like enzyme